MFQEVRNISAQSGTTLAAPQLSKPASIAYANDVEIVELDDVLGGEGIMRREEDGSLGVFARTFSPVSSTHKFTYMSLENTQTLPPSLPPAKKSHSGSSSSTTAFSAKLKDHYAPSTVLILSSDRQDTLAPDRDRLGYTGDFSDGSTTEPLEIKGQPNNTTTLRSRQDKIDHARTPEEKVKFPTTEGVKLRATLGNSQHEAETNGTEAARSVTNPISAVTPPFFTPKHAKPTPNPVAPSSDGIIRPSNPSNKRKRRINPSQASSGTKRGQDAVQGERIDGET